MRFEPLLCMPTAWTSVFDRFAVHLFEGTVTVDDMDLMELVGDRWTAMHGGKRVELSVVFPSNTRLSHDERVRMARLIKHGESHRSAAATVILAHGLLASMQRSVLTGMMMVAPAPHPAKVFGTVDDAAKWLLPHVRTLCVSTLQLDELARALTAHLADFAARPDRPELDREQA